MTFIVNNNQMISRRKDLSRKNKMRNNNKKVSKKMRNLFKEEI